MSEEKPVVFEDPRLPWQDASALRSVAGEHVRFISMDRAEYWQRSDNPYTTEINGKRWIKHDGGAMPEWLNGRNVEATVDYAGLYFGSANHSREWGRIKYYRLFCEPSQCWNDLAESKTSYQLNVPTRERCQDCGRISTVGFWVPDKVWKDVMPSRLQTSVLCVRCFTGRADEKLIPWDREIEFFPVSLATHLADEPEDDDRAWITAEEIASWADGVISAVHTPDLAGRVTEREAVLAQAILRADALLDSEKEG